MIKYNQHGILINHKYSPVSFGTLIIRDSTFLTNNGISLGMQYPQLDDSSVLDIILSNVTFFNDTNLLPNAGIAQVDSSLCLSIEDSCVFKANQGTSVQALATTVTLSGVVTFEDNVAFQGGAISLSYSMLSFVQ